MPRIAIGDMYSVSHSAVAFGRLLSKRLVAGCPQKPVAFEQQRRCCFFGSSSNGSLEIDPLLARPGSASCCCMYAGAPRPARARLRAAASTGRRSPCPDRSSTCCPGPWHSSHAPYGLLKENDRGSSCGTLRAAFRTGQLLRVQPLLAVDDRDHHQPIGQLRRRLDGRLQALLDSRLHQQPVHHDFDGVVLSACRAGYLRRATAARRRCARARIPAAPASPAPSCTRPCGRARSAPGS